MRANGLILLGHGARDPRWAEPMKRLRARIAAALSSLPVELAFLEIMQPALAEAAQRLVASGCERVVIVPIFLGQGGHVRQDVAALVAALRRDHPAVHFDCTAAVGEDDGVLDALAAYCLSAMRAE